MAKPKPTPVPRTPALVRRGAAALAVGFGLTGTACGGIEAPIQPLPTDGSSSEGEPPVPQPPVPQPPVPVPPVPPPLPDGSFSDADFDGSPLPPPVPVPP